jgi:4-hydroxy-tetrahydrodipicolinate synthase
MPLQSDWKGVWTSLITPFNKDLSVDWQAFDRLVDRQIVSQVRGIVLFGPHGEGLSLASHERLAMVRRAKARTLASQKVFVFAGIEDSKATQAAEIAKLAEDAGTDGLFISPPKARFKASGIAKHLRLVMDAVKTPVILDFDFDSLNDIPFEEFQELMSLDQVVGVYTSLDSSALLLELKLKTSKLIYSGFDISLGGSLLLGCEGVISGISNVFPKEWNQAYQAFLNQDFKTFKAHYQTFLPLLHLSKNEPIGVLKACLEELKQCLQYQRLPYEPLGERQFNQVISNLHKTLKNIGEV